MDYNDYLFLLFQRIPEIVFEGIASVFVLGIVLVLSIVGYRKGWRKIVKLLLYEYLFLVYCSTVIFRDIKESFLYKPISFDISKFLFEDGSVHVAPELFFNVLFFVPIGIFMCGSSKCLKWWHVILIGSCISISIEVFQYFLRRGTMEAVDVILNTLGCAIGVMLVEVIRGIWKFCVFLFVLQRRPNDYYNC